MDFREFPTGRRNFAGVPFEVIDPDRNGGKSCIVLAGAIKYFPLESTDIPVGGKVKKLYFLHAAAWGGQAGKQFEYRVAYEDGSTASIPIEGGKECADWVGNTPVANGSIVAETAKPNGVPDRRLRDRLEKSVPGEAGPLGPGRIDRSRRRADRHRHHGRTLTVRFSAFFSDPDQGASEGRNFSDGVQAVV